MGNLEDLANPVIKEELLKAELVAWLHDWEKCSDKHTNDSVRFQGNLDNTDNDISAPVNAQLFIQNLEAWQLHLPGLNTSISFKELIEQGRPSFLRAFLDAGGVSTIESEKIPWASLALAACHSAAHTEKELAIYLLKQLAIEVAYSSSPFGYEVKLLKGLSEKFDTLLFNRMNDSSFKSDLRKIFSYACGDTRRPINDVTLWDWSYMTAALFKAAVAGYVIMGPNDPSQLKWRLLGVRFNGIDFIGRANRIPDLLGRKNLIEDELNRIRKLLEEDYPLGTEVYRDESGSVFLVPDIQNLLMLTNGQGKTLSSMIIDAFDTEIPIPQVSSQLNTELLPLLNLGKSWEWDFDPQKEKMHHLPFPIGEHILKSLPLQSSPSVVATWWQNHTTDVCVVCQLRPQGWGAPDNKAHYQFQAKGKECPKELSCRTCKAINRKICDICEQRRQKNVKKWIGALNTTVWLDEVADVYGKLALIVGKFGLEEWLRGKMVFYPPSCGINDSSLEAAFKIKTLEKSLSDCETVSIFGRNDCYWNQKLEVLQSLQVRRKAPFRLRNSELKTNKGNSLFVRDVDLLPSGQYRIILEKPVPEPTPENIIYIYAQKFRVSENRMYIDTLSDGAKDKIKQTLLYDRYYIIEKYFVIPKIVNKPFDMIEAEAPARLYRVWETTHSFWVDCKENLIGKKVSNIEGRLKIQANPPGKDIGLSRYHTYELKLPNVNLSIACVSSDEYIIVDNLCRTANLLNQTDRYDQNYELAAKDLREYLKGKSFPVEEPTGYGNPNKPLGTLSIIDVTPEPTPYVPAITILTEPRTFMALVPADKALAVTNAIKEKYEREMGKVRNRLPLTLGVVFAGRRTPLPAILDAGRRMLEQRTDSDEWKVVEVDKIKWPEEITLTLERDTQAISLRVPTIMGDEMTEDVWYPYWHLKRGAAVSSTRNRLFKRQYKKIDGNKEVDVEEDWVHITDLQKDDVVFFMPSRFDFEFLDTASRRFEVSYDENGKRRGETRIARPYYLEQLDEIEELWNILFDKLAISQIHNLVELIESKRLAWEAAQDKSVFEKMVCNILHNAGWNPRLDENAFAKVLRAAINGQLTDVVELHMHILKPE